MDTPPPIPAKIVPEVAREDLCREKFGGAFEALRVGNDQIFAIVLAIQWPVLIMQALIISPRTWLGTESATHMHVWAAVLLGGLICLPPAALGWFRRGTTLARLSMTVAQALVVSLLIHLGGGRLEWHFSVFVALAVLSMYRDPVVLITATVVIAADHAFRGLWWPQSIYGYTDASRLLWLEHAVWVLIEVGFLIMGIRRSVREMRQIAEREADLKLLGQVAIARSVDGMIDDIRSIETSGDLTGKVDARFDGVTADLAVAINGFIQTLRSIIDEVRSAATDAASRSRSISGSTDGITRAATAMINEAQSASKAAHDASEVAQQGGSEIGETIQSLERIGTRVQQSGDIVGQLDGQCSHIAELVSVIQDIADQTNLLALNAAIESARAGEHGRGFAVVADEVRKLADRTASVTDEIHQAIAGIQRDTGRAREEMSENSTEASRCVTQSASAADMLSQIVAQSSSLTERIQSLATGFRAMGDDANDVNEAATHLVEHNDHLDTLTAKFKTG